MIRLTIVSSCVFAFTVQSAAAQAISTVVRSGMPAAIVDDHGREVEGRVDSVSDHAVRVRVKKERREIPFDSIVRIERTDGLKNGALTGLCLGVGVGIVGGFADNQGRRHRSNFVFVSALGNGIIWTGLGTAVDAMINLRRTLYVRNGDAQTRVTPIIGQRMAGVALSLTWH